MLLLVSCTSTTSDAQSRRSRAVNVSPSLHRCLAGGQIRADPALEPNQRTYTAVINCFQQFQGGQAVASLASTLAEFSSREEILLNPMPTSDVHLGGSTFPGEGGDVEDAQRKKS